MPLDDKTFRRGGVDPQYLRPCQAWPPFLSTVGAPEQLDVPKTKWCITIRQLCQFHHWMSQQSEYKTAKSEFGSFNCYDMSTLFMQPLAIASTRSVALLFNKREPLDCKLFISHDWAEDINEFQEALLLACNKRRISDDTSMFICIHSIWQRKEHIGEQIAGKVDETPFAQSLQSALSHFGTMIVCTSTSPNPWLRLWTVLEIARTLANKSQVHVAPSRAFLVDPPDGFAGFFDLHTESAACSMKDQREMLLQAASDLGGFQFINQHLQLSLSEFLGDVAMEFETGSSCPLAPPP